MAFLPSRAGRGPGRPLKVGPGPRRPRRPDWIDRLMADMERTRPR